ncbi:group II intron reverse transcriptase/maturase [Halomonas llamarensis]|uniref:Group II intron reverse transcriptase/maturase n=1 Tax=Halomonas llamarensis TaxID=2945104 RepID=A0ABT0SVA1_9GAMM|nr:group II intron reverse transcriptase/maturase [Halomonas llamarensis]MCL7931758.1 group II intron reverse transcriptase/maturase [Halomonas llamarensis]
MADAQESVPMFTKQWRITALAERFPQRAFTSLAHHMDAQWLMSAYLMTRRDGAIGIDGQTADDFASDVDANIQRLLEEAKSGRYRAPPVRRVHIPKGDGRTTRPIGIPTFEDKVLQRAVVSLLEPLYAHDFLPCSYGFRPGHSPHQAIKRVREGLSSMGGGWVIDLDIQAFFDTIDHQHLRAFLQQRVKDGVILRLVGKWLKAGVLEEGQWRKGEIGSPQGGVISPLLANIYLHYVLDEWFETEVKPRLRGRAFEVRFADDAILAFSNEADARKVLEVLPKRFARFGLTLHPTKTRLVRFRPHREQRAETFDFLGFTYYWGKSRRGCWVVKQKTAKDRFKRTLKRLSLWCRVNRHRSLLDQHRVLCRKLQGHFAYYGISGNYRALQDVVYQAQCIWIKWLRRRSQRGYFSWAKANLLLKRLPLPKARIVHRNVFQ